MIRITNLKLHLDDAIDYASEIASLRKLVISKYQVRPNQLLLLKLSKKAIDARRKSDVHFVYTVDIEVTNEKYFLKKHYKNISISPDLEYRDVISGDINLNRSPVIIGFGPSGIFAALILSRRGYNPIILERGYDVDRRAKEWDRFLQTQKFTEQSSVQYGEGGAGTFSDGKLTTLINDIRCHFVLKEFVKAGAHPEIMYVNKPHIGTDVLKEVIKSIRNEIIKNGGIIKFNAKVTDFIIENNKLKGVIVNDIEKIKTDVCLLGIGHSARDTFEVLYNNQVKIEQKAFSMGLRIEHYQDFINKSQYGDFSNHQALGPADYKLTYHSPSGRSAYTFCMCPGGFVVNASSEANTVCTNGMSYGLRDNDLANSAILVNVTPKDFNDKHPLAGMYYQKSFERKAFAMGLKTYAAPVQTVRSFLKNKTDKKLETILPTYQPGTYLANLNELFPNYISNTIREAIKYFDTKINGFASKDAILTGPETRSSSPIRILRDKNHQSNLEGLFPMGEGAGYAGGIMSSAVDGIKTAEKVIEKYVF